MASVEGDIAMDDGIIPTLIIANTSSGPEEDLKLQDIESVQLFNHSGHHAPYLEAGPSTTAHSGTPPSTTEKLFRDSLTTSSQQSLALSPLRSSEQTGLCYDPRMRFHATPDTMDDHPEQPLRISRIFERLKAAGYVLNAGEISNSRRKLFRIEAFPVEKEDILLVHTLEHYENMQRTSSEALSLCNFEFLYRERLTEVCSLGSRRSHPDGAVIRLRLF